MYKKVTKSRKKYAYRSESKMYKDESQLKINDFVFPYGELNPNNEWVQLSQIIPWRKIEERYSKKFVNNGHPAKNVRIVVGSLIIKQTLNCSDEWIVRHISENPYLQYFIGIKEYQDSCPFGASTLVAFRKRFSINEWAEINEMLIDGHDKDQDDSDDSNSGTLLMDATCTPADIAFPQDINLINEAREKTEGIIDELHEQVGGKKPRSDRQKARRNFLHVSKAKKKPVKVLRKAIRNQLGYLQRNIRSIVQLIRRGAHLTTKQSNLLNSITTVYEQQKLMLDTNTHGVEKRIVNLYQPHVRPIVRGKAKSKTEFGAKLHISMVNGYGRIERVDFEAYNEAEDFERIVQRFKLRNGKYPKRILADKIYRNRENLRYCKEHHISISGPALGRPKKDVEVDKKQEYTDICDRNIVEGEFGVGKRSYGWGLITARLKETSESLICITILVMNLRKRLRSFLHLFWQILFQHHKSLLKCA
jgi:IS5 family transposase